MPDVLLDNETFSSHFDFAINIPLLVLVQPGYSVRYSHIPVDSKYPFEFGL